MFGHITKATCLLLTLNTIALAQPAAPATDNNAAVPATEQPTLMEQPLLGDRWTYEVRDEITGNLKFTSTQLVTDVTPSEISIRIETLGNPSRDLYDGGRQPEVFHFPLRFGIKGPWIARPVIGGKGNGEQILVGQKTDAHRAVPALQISCAICPAP